MISDAYPACESRWIESSAFFNTMTDEHIAKPSQ